MVSPFLPLMGSRSLQPEMALPTLSVMAGSRRSLSSTSSEDTDRDSNTHIYETHINVSVLETAPSGASCLVSGPILKQAFWCNRKHHHRGQNQGQVVTTVSLGTGLTTPTE